VSRVSKITAKIRGLAPVVLFPALFVLIFLMNATGSDPVNLTNVRTSTDVHPDWSPDGAKIAFTSTRDGNSEIYVMNADGTGVVNLTNQPETNFSILVRR
ncbi:uncharacterized protein METZ01_LOCUS495813, partial [marine metagenome]